MLTAVTILTVVCVYLYICGFSIMYMVIYDDEAPPLRITASFLWPFSVPIGYVYYYMQCRKARRAARILKEYEYEFEKYRDEVLNNLLKEAQKYNPP